MKQNLFILFMALLPLATWAEVWQAPETQVNYEYTRSDTTILSKPKDVVVTYNGGTEATISWTSDAPAFDIEVNGTIIENVENPIMLAGLELATAYIIKVRAKNASGVSEWTAPKGFTTDIVFPAPTELAAENITSNSADITWTANPAATGATLQYAEGVLVVNEETLSYDDNTYVSSIGNSHAGTWQWGVMYPGNIITANTKLLKVFIFESNLNTSDITIDIYQGGDTAPETLLYSETVTPEAANAFHEVTLSMPVDITAGENLWITLTEYGTYVLAFCENSETNNQWINNSGTWVTIGGANNGWMIRAGLGDPVDPTTLTWQTLSVEGVASSAALVGLNSGTTFTVQVKNYGIDGESAWTTTDFTTCEGSTITLCITDDNGDYVTSDVCIVWYNAEGKEIGKGSKISGIAYNITEVYYSVLLDETLGRVYREVKMRKVMVGEGDETIEC